MSLAVEFPSQRKWRVTSMINSSYVDKQVDGMEVETAKGERKLPQWTERNNKV